MNPDYQKLLAGCLKLLSLRPRSRKEIEDYLHKKTSDPELTNSLINKLTDLKLINDEEFARWLIASRSRSRPRGSRLLKQELKSKGVTMNDNLMTTNDEFELAQKALEKKLNLWHHLPWQEFRIKAWRFLASRGFSSEIIAKAIKNAYNERHVN